MQIAVASGKGGTGKTLFAVGLASIHDKPVTLIDCDVEEPNVHLFISPEIQDREQAMIPVPSVDMSKCTSCGVCREVCRFNAIIILKGRPIILHELCHSCGVCETACPEDAIKEVDRAIGFIETGQWANGNFVYGILDVGEARSVPLIEAVRERGKSIAGDNLIIVDSPPGTSCPVIEAVNGVDFVILVTEPTPFGLHDLDLAVEMARAFKLPVGVIINRSDIGDSSVLDYCRKNEIPVMGEFPFDRKIAEVYSHGGIPVLEIPELKAKFTDLWGRVLNLARESADRGVGT